jgi:hypothetical protein
VIQRFHPNTWPHRGQLPPATRIPITTANPPHTIAIASPARTEVKYAKAVTTGMNSPRRTASQRRLVRIWASCRSMGSLESSSAGGPQSPWRISNAIAAASDSTSVRRLTDGVSALAARGKSLTEFQRDASCIATCVWVGWCPRCAVRPVGASNQSRIPPKRHGEVWRPAGTQL